VFGTSRGEDDEYDLMPTSLYLFGGLTLPLYPLGVFFNPFWITLGALFVTVAVVRDAYRLVNVHDSDWRWAYAYPFVFVVGFVAYPLLLPVYLYHRRRGAARAAGTSYADVQAVRDEMDIPTPRKLYGLLGYDLLVQVVLIGSTSGLLFAGSVALYVVAIPVHGLYVSRDLETLTDRGVPWGRRSSSFHGLSGLAVVLVFVYLFQRTEHVFYAALSDSGSSVSEEPVTTAEERRDFDEKANRAEMLDGE
jgi:hypothetical protein